MPGYVCRTASVISVMWRSTGVGRIFEYSIKCCIFLSVRLHSAFQLFVGWNPSYVIRKYWIKSRSKVKKNRKSVWGGGRE